MQILVRLLFLGLCLVFSSAVLAQMPLERTEPNRHPQTAQ